MPTLPEMRSEFPVDPVRLTPVIYVGTDVDSLERRLPRRAANMTVVRSDADLDDAIAAARSDGPRLICVTTSIDDAITILHAITDDEQWINLLVDWYMHPGPPERPTGDGPLVPIAS